MPTSNSSVGSMTSSTTPVSVSSEGVSGSVLFSVSTLVSSSGLVVCSEFVVGGLTAEFWLVVGLDVEVLLVLVFDVLPLGLVSVGWLGATILIETVRLPGLYSLASESEKPASGVAVTVTVPLLPAVTVIVW